MLASKGVLLQEEIGNLVRTEFGQDPLAVQLVADFLGVRAYRHELAQSLIGTARNRDASWELRRACVLMLENQFLRLRPAGGEEELWLCSQIGAQVDSSLRVRIGRLLRIHRGIRGRQTTPAALGDFFHVARQECKLTLAPYFLGAEEVASRIASHLRTSQGLIHWTNEYEAADLPYERSIAARLQSESRVYWSACNTPRQINSLVEVPIGTVALTLKLPGSDVEFEIKRSGIRSRHPLDVRVFEGTYRLYGGSSGVSSDREARSGVRLAELYRRVHDTPPPLSSSCEVFSIQSVPAWQGEVHMLDYFTDRRTFGNGFGEMRGNMQATVRGLLPDGAALEAPGDLGLTVEFLRMMPPRQAWLANTTSFRLDVLERYLSPAGAESYFARGLARDYTADEARRFADDLLEEILGVYTPPADTTGSYSDYVARAYAEPANRKRADRTYVSLLRQTGDLFGTLLATWGCSFGESFVRRNVGIRSQWRNGVWAVHIIFMDHDALWVPGEAAGDFDPKISLEGLRFDNGYLFAQEIKPEQARGTFRTLMRVYRVDAPVIAKGEAAFREACEKAYRKTRWSMLHNPQVREMMDPDVVHKIADWEAVVWDSVNARRAGAEDSGWESGARSRMQNRGYASETIDEWLSAANQSAALLDRYSPLFDPKYLDFSRSKRQPGG